jgi:hypothetical protein
MFDEVRIGERPMDVKRARTPASREITAGAETRKRKDCAEQDPLAKKGKTVPSDSSPFVELLRVEPLPPGGRRTDGAGPQLSDRKALPPPPSNPLSRDPAFLLDAQDAQPMERLPTGMPPGGSPADLAALARVRCSLAPLEPSLPSDAINLRPPVVNVVTASGSSLGSALHADMDEGLVIMPRSMSVTGIYTGGVASCRCLHFVSPTHIALVHTSHVGEMLRDATDAWVEAFRTSSPGPFKMTVLHAPQGRRDVVEANPMPLAEMLEAEAIDDGESHAARSAWERLKNAGADESQQRRGAIDAMVAAQTRRVEKWAKDRKIECVPMTHDAVLALPDGELVHFEPDSIAIDKSARRYPEGGRGASASGGVPSHESKRRQSNRESVESADAASRPPVSRAASDAT